MYSQFEEEKHILAALGYGEFATMDPTTQQRKFLDVGAWDPITFSNTRALVELGWSGVMIDPAPGPFIELLRQCTKCGESVDTRVHEVYGQRKQRECAKCGAERYGFCERLTLIQAAVGLEPGFMRLCATDDALTTSDEKSRKVWERDGGFYGWITSPVITLDQIANQFGGFDFVNFDVEGYSATLFLQMLKLGWQPQCVCVETDGRDNELIAAATPLHYNVVYGNGQNIILVRK